MSFSEPALGSESLPWDHKSLYCSTQNQSQALYTMPLAPQSMSGAHRSLTHAHQSLTRAHQKLSGAHQSLS